MCPSCAPTGDPAHHPQTSKHGGPVPAPDVRSPAAASAHAADSRPAAAPAQPSSAESGHHTEGQMMSVMCQHKHDESF